MTFRQDKVAKNRQTGKASIQGRSGSASTDLSISDPFTSSDRSNLSPDDRTLSDGDIMKSRGGQW
jgi:hypothetical protein